MLVQELQRHDVFLRNLQELFEKKKGLGTLSPFQEKAWDHFVELGLPTKTQEAFQYFPLRLFYEGLYELPLADAAASVSYHRECKESTIVFVDGRYRPDLSDISALPSNIIALPLQEAFVPYGAFLQTRLKKEFKEERDPFVFYNMAMQEKGLFFYVPPKIVISQPIHCMHIVTNTEKPSVVVPRIYLFLGAFSEVKWVHTEHINQEKCWINFVMDVAVEEGAKLHYTDISTPPPENWVTSFMSVSVKKDAEFKMVNFTEGSKSVRQSCKVVLLGENASANIQGLSILEKNHQSHTNILMEHAAPHTQSMQLVKVVAKDNSQSSFEGKIVVRDLAQKTQAYQLNKNLLLGEHAVCRSKPNLEIFADDVKASHGATMAQIDEEELFYLRARGIGPEEANKLLVEGFCREILDQIPKGFYPYDR